MAYPAVSFIIMATLLQTPKTLCEPIHNLKPSSSRLCQSDDDISHWKNRFSKANCPLVSMAEELCFLSSLGGRGGGPGNEDGLKNAAFILLGYTCI